VQENDCSKHDDFTISEKNTLQDFYILVQCSLLFCVLMVATSHSEMPVNIMLHTAHWSTC